MHSIVEYYAEHEKYKCGYCKRPDTNFSHGMWAHSLTVQDYQDLIDRGWRRSGKYCYKPTMDVTCCPTYTIRCRALQFKASKSQKKVIKKFNKFLSGEDTSDKQVGDTSRKMSTSSDTEKGCGDAGGEQYVENTKAHQDIDVTSIQHSSENLDNEDMGQNSQTPGVEEQLSCENVDIGEKNLKVDEPSEVKDLENVDRTDFKKGVGMDPTKAPCKKAKVLRREKKLEKLKGKGLDVSTLSNTSKNNEKQIEDFINELPKDFQERLEIRLVRTAPPSPEWLATAKETHLVYVKYQTTVHDDKPEKCTMPKFKDFLVESPLLEEHSESAPPSGYGSFHQQYWFDGKIIAVGVIDILPKCVSSVYFFYDPEYRHLTLGTYGALREIAFTRDLQSTCPDLKYYYMGYYIHSCPKMRYKGNFYPSDLLCPETYEWFDMKDCIPKLNYSPYSRLNPDLDSIDTNYPTDNDISYIPVLSRGVVMPYKVYKRTRKQDNSEVIKFYACLVGAKSAKSLILVR